MKKIIYCTINTKGKFYGITANEFAAAPPNIPMELLASYTKSRGIPCEKKYDATAKQLEKEQDALIVIICSGANPSASTMETAGVIDFYAKFSPSSTTAIYGGHPSVKPEETLKATGADYIIIGEGYETIIQLFNGNKDTKGLAYISKNKFHNTGFPKLIDVNILPGIEYVPNNFKAHNWHCFGDLDHRTPYGIIWTSMGCPYDCEFCCINNIFGCRKYRMRDMKYVIKDIDFLVSRGVKHIKILDELFVTKNQRLDEFCSLLEERNYDLNMWCFSRLDTVTPEILHRLKNVGMNWIAYGIETADPKNLSNTQKRYSLETLHNAVKWTRKAGMNICADVIAGLEFDNYDTMQKTYDLCVEYNFEWLNIYPCFAYPGTPLYDKMIRKGFISEPKNLNEYSLYGYDCIPLPTEYLSSREVLEWRDKKFNEYHSRPKYLDMIEKKFGVETRKHILRMISKPLKRRLLSSKSTPAQTAMN